MGDSIPGQAGSTPWQLLGKTLTGMEDSSRPSVSTVEWFQDPLPKLKSTMLKSLI